MKSQSQYSPSYRSRGIVLLLLFGLFFSIFMIVSALTIHQEITVDLRNLERVSINSSNLLNRMSILLKGIEKLLNDNLALGYQEVRHQEISKQYNLFINNLKSIDQNDIATNEIDQFQDQLKALIEMGKKHSKFKNNELDKQNQKFENFTAELRTGFSQLEKKIDGWQKKNILDYEQVARKSDDLLTRYIWLVIAFLSLSLVTTLIFMIIITNRRKAYNNMIEEVYNHLPTGLPNLKQLREDFETNIQNSGEVPLYLLLIDVRAIDIMVQTEGEHEFNLLMLIIRDRIYQVTQNNELQTGLYRYHEGIFALICVNTTIEKVEQVCKSILSSLQIPLEVKDKFIRIFPGIGIVEYPKNAKSFNELIHHGLIALTYCNAEELQNHYLFDNIVEVSRRDRLALISRLRKGFEDNNFTIHYQPRKDCKSNLITCLEAFIRWQDDQQVYSASEFLPIAKNSGLAPKIDLWVLEQVGKNILDWRDQKLIEVKIAINISAASLEQESFIKRFKDWLDKYQIKPQNLIIEVSQLNLPNYGSVAKLAILNALETIREMDIVIALDDFGTNQYVFVDLFKFPIKILKIDSHFVRSISKQYLPEQQRIIPQSAWTKAIISMSHQLNLTVVGEGVETLTQNSLLTLWGCNQIQGRFYCPILSLDKVNELIKNNPQLFIQDQPKISPKPLANNYVLDLVL